jgi:hypothetical protein
LVSRLGSASKLCGHQLALHRLQGMVISSLIAAATVGQLICPPAVLSNPNVIPPAEYRVEGRPPAPYGDVLGDAWEIEEVACWRGIWVPRPSSRLWDGYWFHPSGERVKAPLELWHEGRSVTIVRRHERGQYCRYDGTITPDSWSIEGRYTCTWERTPMRWRAYIMRSEYSLPALLRAPGERDPRR